MKVHILLETRHIFDSTTSPERTFVNRFTFVRGVFSHKEEAEKQKEAMEKEARENPVPNVMERYSIEEHDLS